MPNAPTNVVMESADIDVYGVRDGQAQALHQLAVRRGASVLAYCNHVCGPATGPAAAAETFARTRAVLRDDVNVAALDADQLLKRATRHTAASAARTPQGPPPTGAIPGRGTNTCLDVAIALAAASDGRLDTEQRSRLRTHIDNCPRCAALAEITRRADTAYSDPVNDRIGSEHADRFAAAMASVPPEGPATAPPPTTDSTVATQTAFPTLPDLQDEVADAPTSEPMAEVVDITTAPRKPGRLARVLRHRRAADDVAA